MGWENRLILGDSLVVVMTSLLEKERLGKAGPDDLHPNIRPTGSTCSSNFQRDISKSGEETDQSDR